MGMTPAALSSSKGDSAAGAADTPCHSGYKPDRCRCQSGTDALYAISEAVHSMSVPHPSTSGPSVLLPTSPEHLMWAIKLVEVEEGNLGAETLMQVVDLFEQDSRAPIAYLAFEKRGHV